MDTFKSVDDILDFAIRNEEEAAELYSKLAKEAKSTETVKFFEGLEKEEQGHKAKLLDIKSGKKLETISGKIMDLKISDYLPETELKDNMDYQQALTFAMQAEKAEFKLYKDLAGQTDNQELKNILNMLAQEEAKHKLQLEIEYDEYILTEG
jgi:rubrerythrin